MNQRDIDRTGRFSGDPVPPCTFVLLGATGDLMARKLAPALYNLSADGLLDERTTFLGVARRGRSDEQFRDEIRQGLSAYSRSGLDEQVWAKLAPRWHYQVVEHQTPDDYRLLAARLDEIEAAHGRPAGRVFYLAVPPDLIAEIVPQLAAAGLTRPAGEGAFVRLIVEKPFGSDGPSGRRLNDLLHAHVEEGQIFRIDHYLGKETVQNILVFRFANTLFEPMLNRRFVQRVEITAAETVGMEGRRGAYYESAGALRDMVQSHLLQLLALTAMDPPSCLRCDDVRSAKARLLDCVAPPSPADAARWTVRGQYAAGPDSPAYRQEAGVAPDSDVETYAAVRLSVENERWGSVPFYLRTGKRLAQKRSQITIVFRRDARSPLADGPCDLGGPNRLTLGIAPREGITLTFDAKVPGVGMILRPVNMDFAYGSSFESASPEAYEQLILDAARGDATLFLRADEVDAAWTIVDAVRAAWRQTGLPAVTMYEPLSWGPPDADRIFSDPYTHWHNT